jgi:hypothetical protein
LQSTLWHLPLEVRAFANSIYSMNGLLFSCRLLSRDQTGGPAKLLLLFDFLLIR